MHNRKHRVGVRLALVGLVVAGSVSAVLAHTYRLEPGGEFILADDSGKRRLVVTKGTTFRVGVLDTGGCTADIRAVGGNRRVASVSNPRSQGFVQDQVFDFRANRAGTTTYTITVRGEAFKPGGNEVCDEDSRNPLEISVVDVGGSDKPFARAIRPEIRSATKLMNQLRANLRRQLAEIRLSFLRGQIDAPTLFLLTSVQMSAALFEQVSIGRDALDDMRENEKQRLLSNPVTATLPVPNGLLAGTCGAWDRLVDQMGSLLLNQRGRSKSDLKRHFATIVRDYERDGGYLLWSADYCDYPRIGGGGVSLDDYEKTPRERVRNNLILSYAFAEPDSTTVNRGVVLGLEATSGISTVRTTIRDDDGELDTIDTPIPVLGRLPVLHTLFSRDFGQRVTVDISPDGDPDRTRSRRTTAPLVFVTPRILTQEEVE